MPEKDEIRIGERARALQSSKLVNADLTLRQIVTIQERIPGLGGGNPAGWELINRDFVFRGLPDPGSKFTREDIAALQESEVIDFDMTVRDVLELATQIPSALGTNPAGWELINRDFILRGLPDPEILEATKRPL